MANSASLLNSKSEFDSFLFAPVGEDKRGTVVSVLTAFARLDFDPWLQAADFARLPKEAARTRLASMIATLPGMSPCHVEPSTVAARLIALLPATPCAAVGPGATWLGAGQPANFRSPRYIISIVLLMALGFASQFFMGSLQQQANSAPTQTSGGVEARASVAGHSVPATGSAAEIVATGERDVIDRHGEAKRAPMQGGKTSAVPAQKPLSGK